jgi:hypothetical protein
VTASSKQVVACQVYLQWPPIFSNGHRATHNTVPRTIIIISKTPIKHRPSASLKMVKPRKIKTCVSLSVILHNEKAQAKVTKFLSRVTEPTILASFCPHSERPSKIPLTQLCLQSQPSKFQHQSPQLIILSSQVDELQATHSTWDNMMTTTTSRCGQISPKIRLGSKKMK